MAMKVPRAVGDLISDAVPQLSDRLAALQIKSRWASIVGPDVARRTQPVALNGGCLTITVDNSPWLHELTLRGQELTIRVAAGFPIVRSLRFVSGAVTTATSTPRVQHRRPALLNSDDVHDIEAATSAITDSTLAAAARRLLTTARQFPPP